MSSTKPVLNPRIKISKTGRPYVDVADLVKRELERIERSQERAKNESRDHCKTNGNGSPDNSGSSER